MAPSSKKAHQKLIEAAAELFLSQGIANTATRQIANLAEVNEATLFRNFGNKYGLLQAVIQENGLFNPVESFIKSHLHLTGNPHQDVRQYGLMFLRAIRGRQTFLCSLIGESEHYSEEFKEVFGRKLQEANEHLTELIQGSLPEGGISDQAFMGIFHALLLSHSIVTFSSQVSDPWKAEETYVDALIQLFEGDWPWPSLEFETEETPESLSREGNFGAIAVQDLPKIRVHDLLQQAKKQSLKDYAIAYVLFGAGLSPEELCRLRREDHVADANQQFLIIREGTVTRSVPLNQWILGKRYGSYLNNPLTKWLKSRKDSAAFLLCKESGLPMTPLDIKQAWADWTQAVGSDDILLQSQQTWRVEMLMRGLTVENLSLLTGIAIEDLHPFVKRAQEKIALEQAARLDRKSPS